MKVLVIGNGGREHAIAWKLAQSDLIQKIYVAPGNAGTYREPKVENVPLDPLQFEALADFVKIEQIDFTIVGPEAPLVAGIVDFFHARNLPCLGPTKTAAQLEGSKVFAKTFMQQYQIPTARAEIFTAIEPAQSYLQHCTFPVVIKADGLAGGKGVIIAQDLAQAQHAVEEILMQSRFGLAGEQIIIEDFIEGEEVSFIVLSDGQHFVSLATSQDHKARDDGDQGPNTGGMGAYSPAPLVSKDLHREIVRQVIEPTLSGMAQEGHPFTGFLYAGLMITPQKEIKVLEFNCRLGDPETQPLLMRLTSDFAQLCLAALNGALNTQVIQWDERSALGVVLASHGYPDQYQTGEDILTLSQVPPSKHYKIFHSGTKMEESGRIVTAGGRVLCVTALGHTLQEASQRCYQIVKKIAWNGIFYRTDIGHRGLNK